MALPPGRWRLALTRCTVTTDAGATWTGVKVYVRGDHAEVKNGNIVLASGSVAGLERGSSRAYTIRLTTGEVWDVRRKGG